MIVIDYISYAFLLFFITFFISIFWQFFKTKTIVPRKMFTYKKGGVFEHYIIVGVLLVAIVIGGLVTNQNLLSVENQSTFASIIQTTPILIVGFIFLVFLFVFLFYFLTAFYIKLTKVEDKTAFYQKHTNKMITTAFIISFILILMVILSGLAQLTS
ncbi:MAG: hypothetical protein ACOC1L_00810 [Bacillota bacterium]